MKREKINCVDKIYKSWNVWMRLKESDKLILKIEIMLN